MNMNTAIIITKLKPVLLINLSHVIRNGYRYFEAAITQQ